MITRLPQHARDDVLAAIWCNAPRIRLAYIAGQNLLSEREINDYCMQAHGVRFDMEANTVP